MNNQYKFIILMMLASLTFSSMNCGKGAVMDDEYYRIKRLEMVADQIQSRNILDTSVLEAMKSVPRHLFVPAEYRKRAYDDTPLAIGEDQTISQPYIVAFMTEALNITKSSKVLEIGTGSGYQAAVASCIANKVFSIEIVETLADRAEELLKKLEYTNVVVKCGDGYSGWPENAPFDAIILTAAPPKVPQPLIDQLAEGGRMVIPVGGSYQELLLIKKINGQIIPERLLPVSFVPMTGKAQENH